MNLSKLVRTKRHAITNIVANNGFPELFFIYLTHGMMSMYKENVNIITSCIAPKTQKISKANIVQLPWQMLIILKLYDFELCFEKFIDGWLLLFFYILLSNS